jgi:hypothetical protein
LTTGRGGCIINLQIDTAHEKGEAMAKQAYIKWYGRRNGQERRAELRAGANGKGKVIQVVNYWPEHSASISAASDTFYNVARREGYTIVGSDRDTE